MASNGGISSLGGFAYQIKAFLYYLEQLKENTEIGYETYEDVSINYKPDEHDYIDKKCVNFNSLYKTTAGITAIQVKRKKLNEKDFDQLLYNWLILELSENTIVKYILLIDGSYNNLDLTFAKSAQSMYDEIINAKDDGKSLKCKVKKLIGMDYENFVRVYNEIKNKYEFKTLNNIDDTLEQVYGKIFHKPRIYTNTFKLRLDALLSKITTEIMMCVVENKPYVCSYNDFIGFIEDITLAITDKEIYMDFCVFKSLNHINLKDTNIAVSRQYMQLCTCFRFEKKIEEHLIYEQYYNDYKLRSLGNMKKEKIDNIEETTYSHFTDTVEYLINTNNDNPYLRLDGTKLRGNSYTLNEQIYYGSAIHLTKADTESELLISWKDDDNE